MSQILEETYPTNSTKNAKNFSDIISEYDFFRAHATEYQSVLNVFTQKLKYYRGISILDFGAGDGKMLFDLYWTAKLWKSSLRIGLVEPVETYRQQASHLFRNCILDDLNIKKSLDDSFKGYDVAISNHVLYYVNDLDKSIRDLLQAVRLGGEIWIVMANHRNQLVQLGNSLFSAIGEKFPYYTCDDLKVTLDRLSIPFTENTVHSNLRFKDLPQNRRYLAKFVLGDSSSQLDHSMLKYIDGYKYEDSIDLHLSDTLICISK